VNDLELETRLREQLPRLAEYATVAEEPSPSLASVRATPVRAPRRGKRIAAAVAVVAAVIVVGVVVVDALRTPDHLRPVAPIGEPTGPAVHSLTIAAINFHFEAMHYDVPAGITELHLVSDEGVHTLIFDQPQFAYVHLAAPGGPTSVKVDFVEGHTYGIFDPLPGHQRAGEVATISVGPPESATHMVATTSTTTATIRP
jgi:hypothetical protein